MKKFYKMNEKYGKNGFGAERFVASLLASLTLGHITADKREIKDFPKLPSATSFIRKTLSEIVRSPKKI